MKAKTLIIGILIGIFLVVAIGATTMYYPEANKLILDSRGNLLVVDLRSATARYVVYETGIPSNPAPVLCRWTLDSPLSK